MIGKLTEQEIDKVLSQNIIGRLGCSEKGKPYVVPLGYIYQDGYIISHSETGMKIRVMRNNPVVCFQVDEIKTHNDWKSVIVWGRYEELTEEIDQYNAMKLFVDRMMHLKISETARPPELSGERLHPRSPGNIWPVVFRIKVNERSGRYETT
jgi:nitroimidazol reductase NimA-like FMN-containing flavoprotein (pyridoxamine 5'-phosphate oxidase superfamily)